MLNCSFDTLQFINLVQLVDQLPAPRVERRPSLPDGPRLGLSVSPPLLSESVWRSIGRVRRRSRSHSPSGTSIIFCFHVCCIHRCTLVSDDSEEPLRVSSNCQRTCSIHEKYESRSREKRRRRGLCCARACRVFVCLRLVFVMRSSRNGMSVHLTCHKSVSHLWLRGRGRGFSALFLRTALRECGRGCGCVFDCLSASGSGVEHFRSIFESLSIAFARRPPLFPNSWK